MRSKRNSAGCCRSGSLHDGQVEGFARCFTRAMTCTDIDLNFSPSTNLLPVRRLELAIGSARAVRAAWLRFPSFTLKEPLEQTDTRLDERLYRYESAGGSFVALVTVDDFGLAMNDADRWSRETGA